MTILHLSAVKNWGGGENHIENLTFELSQSNPEVSNIILCKKNGKFHDRLKASAYHVETAPLNNNLDLRYLVQLINLCKRYRVDLIHIHDPRAMTLAIMADKLYNLPPFVFSKKTSFPVKKRKQTLYKYNYRKIKKFLCVSDKTKKVLSEAIVNSNKLITIYHGTRTDNKSRETPFDLRERFNIPPHLKIIGNIANHQKAKNLATFIDVADYLINTKKNKDFCFIQIGTFTERTEDLQQKVKLLGLEDHVCFLGFIPNASNFLSQFDFSLITSTNEGVPQVIYESFNHNIPVVSTNVAGIPEVIEHGENGLLANMHDYKNLSNHILFLNKRPDVVEKFTQVSQMKLTEKFTTKIMAEKTLAVYKKVLHERP